MRRLSRIGSVDSCYFGRYRLVKLPDRRCKLFGRFNGKIVPRVAKLNEDRSSNRAGTVVPDTRRQSKRVPGAGDNERRDIDFREPLGKIDPAATIVPADPMFVLRDERVVDNALHALA